VKVGGVSILVPNLHAKKKYVLHSENLKLYVKKELGELQIYFRKIPLQNFWWTRFFLIRLGCREI